MEKNLVQEVLKKVRENFDEVEKKGLVTSIKETCLQFAKTYAIDAEKLSQLVLETVKENQKRVITTN